MLTRAAHTILLSTLVYACASQPMPTLAPGAQPARTVSVSGTATTRVTPDTVMWQVRTTSTDANLVRAKEASDAQMQAILKTARDLGVPGEDLQTGHLEVHKEYERGQYGDRGRFKRFRVARQLTIKQRGTERFDRFLTGLVQSADMDVSYGLTSSKRVTLRAETRLEAVAAARDKASAMAQEVGETLGPVLQLEEKSEPGYGNREMSHNVSLQSIQMDGGGDVGTFAPGTIEVRVSVGAVFALN